MNMNTIRSSDEDSKTNPEVKMRIKVPKKILHFSDGTLEEYSSSDEETQSDTNENKQQINPKMLTWGPWFWYQSTLIGSTSLKVCDFLGESLANFFGITTPKYQFEIDEYNRMVKEEKEEKEKEELQMGGWIVPNSQPISTQAPNKNEELPQKFEG